MGIACAPQIWMDYITLILSELKHKHKYIAIMDDMLIHSSKQDHWHLFEQLSQSMCKNGLHLSPKKCQLFRTHLTYIRNDFVIRKKSMIITPLKSRTEAIAKIPTPRTAKQCKSFCGVVNYLSLFCPYLQTLLKPIVELTWKGHPHAPIHRPLFPTSTHQQDGVQNILDPTKYTTRRYALETKPQPGIDTGEEEELLEPEIKIPLESDFIQPPTLDSVIDISKVTHKFLPKQGEVDCLIKQIN